MNNKIIDIIKNICAKLGITVDGIEEQVVAGHTLFMIQTKDSGALIGSRGDTLSALNHIVKKAMEGEADEEFRFVVDVNGYHLKHIKSLENQAKILAERARTFKYDVEMSPMSPYDRLIVHSILQEIPDVATESRGEGPARHIVIKYVAPTSEVSA